jgi:UDP-N-acetylglucosamine diphosphorylase/glucosamine-1-phosphate N-acetyltransferase
MEIVLDDTNGHLIFAPLTLSRPVGDLRVGIFSNTERFNLLLPLFEIKYKTEQHLTTKFKSEKINENALYFNARFILNELLALELSELKSNEVLIAANGELIAYYQKNAQSQSIISRSNTIYLETRWDLYLKNEEILKSDFVFAVKHFKSISLSKSNTIIGDQSQIFLCEGAIAEASIFNTSSGPIFIGKNAEVMEGCLVRGAMALCDGAILKMGAKIYGASTFGPNCRIGGEVSNSLFQANSNKGHDGFVGNSLIGEWCNLGADTNTSNLKNNYGLVSTFSYVTNALTNTQEQFMGLTMGDHSKAGINTMFNTATVVGFSANIYGGDFPEKTINSFSWGGPLGFEFFKVNKAIEVAKNMMSRRHVEFEAGDQIIFDFLSATSSHNVG